MCVGHVSGHRASIQACVCMHLGTGLCKLSSRVNQGSLVRVNTGIGVCVHVAGWEMAASLQPCCPGAAQGALSRRAEHRWPQVDPPDPG